MLDQIPDSVKVGASLSAPALTFLGITVEDWTYIMSAIVSLLFIVEKIPIFIVRVETFKNWVQKKYNASKK